MLSEIDATSLLLLSFCLGLNIENLFSPKALPYVDLKYFLFFFPQFGQALCTAFIPLVKSLDPLDQPYSGFWILIWMTYVEDVLNECDDKNSADRKQKNKPTWIRLARVPDTVCEKVLRNRT